MDRRSRTRVRTSAPNAVAPITFPGELLQPPQSQVSQYADMVSQRVTEIDLHAQKLAEGFGIPYTTFVLNPVPAPRSDEGLSVAVHMLRELVQREERVTLERRNGRWGLFYTRSPAIVNNSGQQPETMPLRDTPLDVRERFLRRSEEFVRGYFDLCKDRLGQMRTAVSQADRTLALLQNVTLT